MEYGRISDKQREILEYMKQEILNKGYPPTVRELCDAVHLKSTSSIHSHLETLEKNGYIQSFPDNSNPSGKRRTYYRITDSGRQYYREKCDEWLITKEVVEKFIIRGNMTDGNN